MDGKNIADFIDPDIAEKLEALEREEERLQAEGFYDSDSDMVIYTHFFYHYFSLLIHSSFPASSTRMTNVKPKKPKSLFPTRSNHRVSKNPKRIKLVFHVPPACEHFQS